MAERTLYPFAERAPEEAQISPAPIDYSLLSGLALRANNAFESNVSQVKKGYDSILNAQVTGSAMDDRKQQYIKSAQSTIKQVSQSDLSNPQNVLAATQAYAPFYQDEAMMHNISKTSQINNNKQQGESDRLNSDKAIRDTYNLDSVIRQEWASKDLADAGTDLDKIRSIEVPQYSPRTDPMTYMDSVDKAEGFTGADFSQSNGKGGLIIEHDGLKAVPQFTTRIDAALGAQFNNQFSDQGYNWYRQEKELIMKHNPGISEDQVNQELGKQRYSELKGLYADKVKYLQGDIKKSFDDPIAMIKATINGPDQKGKPTQQQLQDIQKLQLQKQGYVEVLSRAEADNKQFNADDPQKLIADVAKNPQEYYTRQVRETTINNLAKGRAMGDYSIKLDVDKGWQAASESSRWRSELNENVRYHNLEHQDRHEKNLIDDRKNLIDAGYTYDSSGQLVAPSGAVNATTGVNYEGENTTGLSHGHFSDILEQEKNANWRTAVGATYSPNGVTGVLTVRKEDGGLGLPSGLLADFNTLYTRLNTPENHGDPNFKPKPEEAAAWNTVYDNLTTYFGKGHPIPRTYEGLQEAIHQYVADQNAKRVTTGTYTDANSAFAKAFTSSELAKDALNNYSSMVNQEKEWINHLAKSSNKYHKLISDNGRELAGINDYKSYIPNDLSSIDYNGKTNIITRDEMAKAIKKGDYKVDKEFDQNGQPYNTTITFSDGKIVSMPSYIIDPVLNKIYDRFGDIDERNRLNNDLSEDAASNLKFIKDKTGQIGGVFHYTFGNDKTPGPGEKLISETLLPSNSNEYYDGEGKLIDPADINKIRGLANSYKSIRDNIGEPRHSEVSEYGAPVTTFSVNSWTDKNGKIHSGETITAVQSPNAKGDFISSIPKNSGVYVYRKLQEGQSINSDHMSDALGFKYSIDPNNRDNPTAVTISVTRKKYNPGTDKIEDFTYPPQQVDLSVGPDKIMAAVSKMQSNAIVDLANEQKQLNVKNAR